MRPRSNGNAQSIRWPSFSEAISAHRGLRSIARAKKTASASPLAMMCSACSGSVIRPTAAVGMSSVRMAVVKERVVDGTAG